MSVLNISNFFYNSAKEITWTQITNSFLTVNTIFCHFISRRNTGFIKMTISNFCVTFKKFHECYKRLNLLPGKIKLQVFQLLCFLFIQIRTFLSTSLANTSEICDLSNLWLTSHLWYYLKTLRIYICIRDIIFSSDT